MAAQLFETEEAVAGYARVALEQGIDAVPSGLTYAVPLRMGDLRVGQRVTVPLGRRDKRVSGYVVERMDACDLPADGVKPILARDAPVLSLTDDLIDLARWMSNYYCCPLGMVLVSMLPAAVKRGTGTVSLTRVFLGDAPEAATRLTKLQRSVLDVVRAAAGEGDAGLEIRELANRAGARSIAPVKVLIEKGVLTTRRRTAVRAAPHAVLLDASQTATPPGAAPRHALTTAQTAAVEQMVAGADRGFSVHLLHGVTGSGKTEVYLRVIERLLDEGSGAGSDGVGETARSGAIVLVPEIALTPQTVAHFVSRFPNVAVLHSGLTGAQRHEQWRRIREGDARIVVGARSAVFAPLSRVGIIIVDEEHESSYKQDQLPRYHARDVAIRRGQMHDALVVLGSATPSLESYHHAVAPGRYQLLRLPQRVTGLQLPKVEIVDMRQERRKRYAWTGKGGIHLLSLRLESVLHDALEAGGQAILLLNRRGYANYIACSDHHCGWLMNCEYCDATVVYHKDRTLPTGGFVQCHHCGAEQMLPRFCPDCRTHRVTSFGLGTQRVEEELGRKFPGARLLRMDSDSMRSGRDYHECLELFRAGDVDVLVGTQMIAKGLDFPNVRVVGVISADTALNLPDFRSSERTFQLISQVAGRAGRGSHPGLVVVQSFSPDDPAIRLAAAHDYETFAEREIELRRSVGLPPAARMARVVVRYRDLKRCSDQAQRLADAVNDCNERLGLQIKVRGPAPCPIARIAEYHRQQIELISPQPDAASRLQKLMTALRNARVMHSDVNMAVDVDPVAMM